MTPDAILRRSAGSLSLGSATSRHTMYGVRRCGARVTVAKFSGLRAPPGVELPLQCP